MTIQSHPIRFPTWESGLGVTAWCTNWLHWLYLQQTQGTGIVAAIDTIVMISIHILRSVASYSQSWFGYTCLL